MIQFSRYPHVLALFTHYANEHNRDDILRLLEAGLNNNTDAETLSRFAWEMAAWINEDEEQGVEVLGSKDNTDMLPDLSYEMSLYMKDHGYYPIWERISNDEMS